MSGRTGGGYSTLQYIKGRHYKWSLEFVNHTNKKTPVLHTRQFDRMVELFQTPYNAAGALRVVETRFIWNKKTQMVSIESNTGKRFTISIFTNDGVRLFTIIGKRGSYVHPLDLPTTSYEYRNAVRKIHDTAGNAAVKAALAERAAAK